MFQIPNMGPLVLMGIDPGTDTLGLSIMKIDPLSYAIIESSATTFHGRKVTGYNSLLEATHGSRIARLHAHRQNLYEQFCIHRPTVVASETPFFNRFRPNAFGPLVETMWCIREALWMYDQRLPLVEISPRSMKQTVGLKNKIGKDDVKLALLGLKDILKISESELLSLDEHAIDALGIVYTAYQQIQLGHL